MATVGVKGLTNQAKFSASPHTTLP